MGHPRQFTPGTVYPTTDEGVLYERDPDLTFIQYLMLKGAGGSEVDFHFFAVSDRGEY